jgi:hypothetical protein
MTVTEYSSGVYKMAGCEMRVLFIDFDGVLHRAGNGVEDVGPTFTWLPLLVAALDDHSDVVIVVHSTWRYQYTLDELKGLLVGLERHIIAVTPHGPRRESIPWFRQMHPAITSFRILDDEAREFGGELPPELLLCKPSLGLNTPGVLQALEAWLVASSKH